MRIYGGPSNLKYEFRVAPGADWQQIAVSCDGVQSLELNDAGDLVIGTPAGQIVDRAPVVYQMNGNEKAPVAGQYRLFNDDTYGFTIMGDYDPNAELVIDPDVAWIAYLGGSGQEFGWDTVLDGEGSVYVTGGTTSPTWGGSAPGMSYHAGMDAFVAKLNAAGDALVYYTYLGGASEDRARGIAVDSTGNAYVTGYTYSSGWATTSAYDTSLNGSRDVSVAKLSPTGTSLLYSTYLGGSGLDEGWGIAVDGAGSVSVAGYTCSGNFPTGNPLKAGLTGTHDAFVAKLKPWYPIAA